MLKSIRLENFFSFQDTTIELEPDVNILIGINGSGKSNLLKAISVLQYVLNGQGLKQLIINEWGGIDEAINFSKGKPNFISLTFEFDNKVLKDYGYKFTNNIFYNITINKLPSFSNYLVKEKLYSIQQGSEIIFAQYDGSKYNIFGYDNHKDVSIAKTFDNYSGSESAIGRFLTNDEKHPVMAFQYAIKDILGYPYFDTTPQSRIRKPILPSSESRLTPIGENLTQMLNTIKINDKDNYKKILAVLQKVNDKYTDIDFNNIGGNIELTLEEKGLRRSIHVSKISDGTLHFLCLLAICYNPNPQRGALVDIDEPETGLHPDMILTVCDAIKHAAEDGTQIIISTHSELILNVFDLRNIRVFEKDENNSTIVNSYIEEDFAGWYEVFFPGKMWRKGDLGGNRW